MSRHPIAMNIESRESEFCDYPKAMHDIYDALKAPLIDTSNSNSSAIALEQLECICSAYGGKQIYLSSDTITFRNLRLCRDFDGNNALELANRYGVSKKNVQFILRSTQKKLPLVSFSQCTTDAKSFDDCKTLFHKTTIELYGILADTLDKHSVGKHIAYAQLSNLIRKYGGKVVYIPNGSLIECKSKHFDIWHDYDGNNIRQLIEKYDLSESQIWRVVANMRELSSNSQ